MWFVAPGKANWFAIYAMFNFILFVVIISTFNYLKPYT